MLNPCPEYAEMACCNKFQYQALGIHLYVSASAFSKPSTGGNPACGENLRQLWCGLTCHPNQSMWVDPSPVHQQQGGYEVMPANISLGSTFACGLFDSCKSTQKAALDPVLTTSLESFLDFMGRDQGKSNGVWYTFDYVSSDEDEAEARPFGVSELSPEDEDEAEAVPHRGGGVRDFWGPPLQYCCNYNSSVFAFNTGTPLPPSVKAGSNMSAPCSFCQTSCPHHTCPVDGGSGSKVDVKALEAPLYGPWHGLVWTTLVGVYAAATVATAGISVLNCVQKSRS